MTNFYCGLYLALIWLLLLCPSVTGATNIEGTTYVKQFYRLDTDEEFPLSTRRPNSLMYCIAACRRHPTCVSVNFMSDTNTCMGVNRSFFTFGVNLTHEPDWDNSSPYPADSVRDGDWILMFRAQKGLDEACEGKTLQAWNNDSIRTDDALLTVDPNCYSPMAGSCKDYFRSKRMTDWPSNVKAARLVLYAAGKEVAYIEFGGSLTSRDDWFRSGKVTSSSWTDLTPPDPSYFFNVNGQLNQHRMFVATSSGTEINVECASKSWVVAFNKQSNRCTYDRACTNINFQCPQFLYSATAQANNFNDITIKGADSQYVCPQGQADVFAFFIKLE